MFVWLVIIGWLAAICATVLTHHRRITKSGPPTLHLLVIATALAVWLTQLPTNAAETAGAGGWLNTAILALLETIRVFAAENDSGALRQAFDAAPGGPGRAQALLVGLLHTAAPVVLITAVVAYFQTPAAWFRYMTRPWRNVEAFSGLSEQSLALARSLREKDSKTLIVFSGVVVHAGHPSPELIAQARALGAIFFKKDLKSSRLTWRTKRARLRIFIIGEDEAVNAWAAMAMLNDPLFRDRENTDLYVFATTVEGDIALMNRQSNLHIRVRRINPARAMVYDWLWRDEDPERTAGVDLFRNTVEEDGRPVISAAIVGLGAHGTEMLRALTWYCRMILADGRRTHLKVCAFDRDADAETRIRSSYPGLLPCRDLAGLQQETEVTIYGGVDATTSALVKALRRRNLTFIFIALGDDARNIRVAVELYRECVRLNYSPQILTVSKNSSEMEPTLKEIEIRGKITSQKLPRIHLIGDLSEVFSHRSIIQPDLELHGLLSHLTWDYLRNKPRPTLHHGIDGFWASEYNYTSSIAAPIHWKARRTIGTPRAVEATAPGRPPWSKMENLGDEDLALMRLEHDRWCSFMLSEGFILDRDRSDSSYLVRMHSLLIPFDDPRMTQKDKEKDHNDSRAALEELEKDQIWQATAKAGGRLGALIKDIRNALN